VPNTPEYLAHARLAYVGRHSFVLLIGALAVISAISFYHNPDAPQYLATRHSGPGVQWTAYSMLGVGGLVVIVGLVTLQLALEAAGHILICSGLILNGVGVLYRATLGFDTTTAIITLVIAVGCIAYRIWALFQALVMIPTAALDDMRRQMEMVQARLDRLTAEQAEHARDSSRTGSGAGRP
jgi:hypothetical protein